MLHILKVISVSLAQNIPGDCNRISTGNKPLWICASEQRSSDIGKTKRSARNITPLKKSNIGLLV